MTVVEKIRYLSNSPTHERDVATIFTVPRLGVWFFFLNAALLFAIGGTFMLLSENSIYGDSNASIFQSLGLSDILTSVIFLSMSAFLTIFVPIRVVGPIMGPRVGRYFDQIVLSGISPTRYFIGKILSQNAFLGVVAVAALPYLVLCIGLGGISIKYTLLGIGVLAFYTNVLALCTLLLSVFITEIGSIIVTLLLFTAVFFAGFMPLRPNPFPLSPSAVFISPLLEADYAQSARLVGTGFQLTDLFGLALGNVQLMIFFGTGFALAAVCIAWLVLGPLSCIVQENSTFGEVVLKGDAKKRSFLKRRPSLRLRSEISFFYENRAEWLRKWDFLIRWGIAEVIFLLTLGLPFLVIPELPTSSHSDELVLLTFCVGLFWLCLNNAFFLKDRPTERLHDRGMETGQIDLLFYFANLAMIAFGSSLLLSTASQNLEARWIEINQWTTQTYSPFPMRLHTVAVGTTLCIFGFELHWFLRWMSTRFWSKWTAFVGGISLFIVFTILLPFAPYWLFDASGLANRSPGLGQFSMAFAYVSYVMPLAYCIEDYPYSELSALGEKGLRYALMIHTGIGLAFTLAYLRSRKNLTVRRLY